MRDRDEAQRRVHQVRAFRAELDALAAAGIAPLAPEQTSAVARYHDQLLQQLAADFDVDRSESAGRLSRGMRLLSLFAAVALTAAVFSLVERFWGRIDLPLQATLLAAFPLMALVGVEFSARREPTLYVAALFAIVAYGTFWLAIGTLSWTINMPVTPPFIWAGVVFGLALAIPYRFHLILGVALAALAVAMAGTLFQVAGTAWSQAFYRYELLTVAGFSLLALYQPLATIERSFAPIVRLVAVGIGLCGLLILSLNGRMSLLPFSPVTTEAIYQGVMLVVSIACLAIGIRRQWPNIVNLAAVLLAVFLVTRYVDWFIDVLPRYVFFLILAAVAFLWLIVLRRLRVRLGRSR